VISRHDPTDFFLHVSLNRRLLFGLIGGRSSSIGGPCLSLASWSAFPFTASVYSKEAERGVNGFGSFCRNKRASAAGPKTGDRNNGLRALNLVLTKLVEGRYLNSRPPERENSFSPPKLRLIRILSRDLRSFFSLFRFSFFLFFIFLFLLYLFEQLFQGGFPAGMCHRKGIILFRDFDDIDLLI
jgi:hypothetical protein